MDHQDYPEPDIPADEAWESMGKMLDQLPAKSLPGKTGRPQWRKFLPGGATGLVFIAVITYFYWGRETKLPAASRTVTSQAIPLRDTLKDGTMVFLNSQSSFSETPTTSGESIITIRGAAYITSTGADQKAVHRLRMGGLEVIPATASLYMAYDTALGMTTVHVQSGTAAVTAAGKQVVLQGGESIAYDEKAQQISGKRPADVNLYSYATRIFEFSDTPLTTAAACIEKAYGVKIVLLNERLKACSITTRFDNKSLNEILDLMAYTLNFEYRLDEETKQVTLTGGGCE
jgi:transmembrane sensor